MTNSGIESSEIDRNGALVVPVRLSQSHLRQQLLNLMPWGGWRHQFHFSNGLSISDIDKSAPWTEQPLNKIKIAEREGWLPADPAKVLDIGCNVGYNAIYLAKRYGHNVTGIDVTPNQIEFCQFLASSYGLDNVEFLLADAESHVEPESFDTVVHFGTLYHLPNVVRALEAASNNLKTGGMLLLETQCYGKDDVTSMRYVRGFNGDDTNWWAPSESVLLDMLGYCGFSEIKIFFSWTSPLLDGMHRVMLAAKKISEVNHACSDLPDGQRPTV